MSDCCSAPGLLPFEDALAKMLEQVTPITQSRVISIENAVNCVLAHTIKSPINVPPHDNSAMDGYAFSHHSLAETKSLILAGRSMAGAPFQGECLIGQCIRIMTGAKLPKGCDSVEMQENCDINTDINDNSLITFLSDNKLGSHVRKIGEDISQGQVVFAKGHRLTTVDIGILASLGFAEVEVYRKINVALIATGDELKKPNQGLSEGDIYESNSYVLAAMLEKLNVNVIDFGIIEDDFNAIKFAFEQADQQADVVISSGGVSVGDADYTKDVLDELGKISFWKIAMKPGKPFAFGKLSNSLFFGLPGNPVSALVTFHQLAIHALVKLQNAPAIKRTVFQAVSVSNLKKSPGRLDFQRGQLQVTECGKLNVISTGSQGSGILSSLANANCYIILPSEQGNVTAGDKVTVQLFDQYIS